MYIILYYFSRHSQIQRLNLQCDQNFDKFLIGFLLEPIENLVQHINSRVSEKIAHEAR